jgi:uncharacterized protein YecE (DUF72 family)
MAKKIAAKSGRVRVGIGGWIYPPWRGVFYPKGLPQSQELAYASGKLTSIEINATFYRLQSPASFRKWAEAAPEGFAFSVKGPRLVTQQKVLAETGAFIRRFLESGLAELGGKLGPVLWQFAPFKRFDPADFAKFLALLPRRVDGLALNHVVEVRHESFCTQEFVELLRDAGVSVAYSDAEAWPRIADAAGEVVYLRLQKGDDTLDTAYPHAELDAWARRARAWSQGAPPADLPLLAPPDPATQRPRDVFVYFIHAGKLRAPAAAMALIERLRIAAC